MISRIETMHRKGILHRDIKPDNFLWGPTNKVNTLYVIDFGLSKRYIDYKSGQHIEFKKKKFVCGTPMFISVNAHRGFEQSRRDDLESIAHNLIYFYNNGNLPWFINNDSDLVSHFDEKEACKIKRNTDVKQLCSGLPECLELYVKYVRNL